MEEQAGGGDWGEAGAEAVAGIIGASLGAVGGPPLSIAGAAAGPLAVRGARTLVQRWSQRRLERAEQLLAIAAREAGIDPDELVARLEAEPAKEDLLVRTLKAAVDSALVEKLVASAVSLASAATSESNAQVQWESGFIRALDDLDSGHLTVLDRFTWSARRLGLGEGDTVFEEQVKYLNCVQLERIVPELSKVLDSIVAMLQGHGLITVLESGGGGTLSGMAGRPGTYALTDYGRAFVERLRLVGKLLE